MRIAGLIVTTLLMLGSGVGFVICLILPGVTRNVSVQEAMIVAIPLAILCFISFLGVVLTAILVWRNRKSSDQATE